MSEGKSELVFAVLADEWHFRLECGVKNVMAVHEAMSDGNFSGADAAPALFAAWDYRNNLQREFRGMLDSYFAQVQEEEKGRKEAAQCPQTS